MTLAALTGLRAARDARTARGVVSVCSAHPGVIEAALTQARDDGVPALIEATCNQVNQDGGYTGMDPAGFARFVRDIAARVGVPAGMPAEAVILGGDHLGPNPWRRLDAEAAMDRACAMVAAYARAGFAKLHLDTSMGCAGEAAAPPDAVVAARAARLAQVAEQAARQAGLAPPLYVIGTEVPTPGGAAEALDHLTVTTRAAAMQCVAVHRQAFAAHGLEAAFDRVIALVVQPGVEFGPRDVVAYDRDAARGLCQALDALPGLVFEAHSTDYQSPAVLAALVQDGFAILKVGPALTFAWREALYGLDHIAAALDPTAPRLADAMERAMLDTPAHWQGHYHGDAAARRVLRHYGYSDRIRYYWPLPAAQQAAAGLLDRLAGADIPDILISQFLPRLYRRVAERSPHALLMQAVRDTLADYASACDGRRR